MSGFGGPGFQVIDNTELGTHFAFVEGTSTLYTGEIVYSYRYGMETLGVAAGFGNLSNKKVPYGIVIAGNNKLKTYGSSAYGSAESTVGVNTAAGQIARDFRGAEGMHPKGDPVPMVQLAMIGPSTRIRGRLFNASYGTAPTVAIAASGLSTAAMVTNNIDVATVAYNSVCYCRSGANRGLYRVVNSAHDTTHTFAKEFPYTIVAGDTFVFGPRQGLAKVQFDALAQYIDVAGACTSAYYYINVLRTSLEVAGEEHVIFTFNPVTFLPAIAAS